jgi:pimeloyl-ACP methyl ester carboxylesterase
MPTTRVLGADLYYERHGQGPPLLFAHGVGGNHLSWWQQVPHFRDRYTCLTFDHPGFGQSAPPPGDNWSFVDCLAALLDELGLERVSLVAQSMGGRTCLGYTLRHPERVAALVMADTILPLELPEFGDWRAETRHRRDELVARGVHPACGETMAREQPALHFLYQQLSALNPPWSPDNPPPGGARVPAAGHADLRGYATPTLFIIGEEDAVIPPRILELGAAAVPGARVARVPRAGHSVYFERPAEFNRLVDEFLSAVLA